MFQILYYYSSKEWSLIEIKRLDAADTSLKHEVYYWLRISHRDFQVTRFHFKAIDKHSRTFDEGVLELKGIFRTRGEEHPMKTLDPQDLAPALLKAIETFLRP